MRRARGPLAAMVLTIVGACHGVPADDRQEIAALRLTCVPIPQGIRCLLLALSRHVARAPRDVTADAVWRFDGPTGATMSSAGMVQATQTGEVGITAEYRSRRARADAWLAPNARGEMLGTVRGYVYVDQNFVLHPLGSRTRRGHVGTQRRPVDHDSRRRQLRAQPSSPGSDADPCH